MVVAGGAWPLLVALTPASSRPWISGTSDNSIWSLIIGYNGLGRLDGQAGGPGGGMGGGGGGVFGGDTGVFRLLNSALGGQAGWLLGFALIAGVALVVSSRLRRSDPVTGWILAVGGSALTAAVAFSTASGIFHPYYVSELAPFVAALVGAGVVRFASGDMLARIAGPLAIAAGVITRAEGPLATTPGSLEWLPPVLVVVGVVDGGRARLRPGRPHPQRGAGDRDGDAADRPGDVVGPDARPCHVGHVPGRRPGQRGDGRHGRSGRRRARRGGFGGGQGGPPAGGQFGGPPGANGATPGGAATRQRHGPGAGGPDGGTAPGAGGGFGGGPGGGMFGGNSASLTSALAYIKANGGGTLAVSSQSTAAAAITASDADIVGIGGFSGRESEVSVAWLADQVAPGQHPLGPRRLLRRRRAAQRRPHRLDHRDGRGRRRSAQRSTPTA